MSEIDIDDLLRLFYAAASSVQDGKVGEVEFEQESGDGEHLFRISVRREPASFNHNTHFHNNGEEDER